MGKLPGELYLMVRCFGGELYLGHKLFYSNIFGVNSCAIFYFNIFSKLWGFYLQVVELFFDIPE